MFLQCPLQNRYALKKPVLKYLFSIVILVGLFANKDAFGQVTVNTISNSSITTAIARGDNNSYAVFGFDIQVGPVVPNPKIQGIRIVPTATSGGGNFSSGEPFSSFTLFKSTTNSSTYTSGSVASVSLSGSPLTNGNSMEFPISSGLPLSANTHN